MQLHTHTQHTLSADRFEFFFFFFFSTVLFRSFFITNKPTVSEAAQSSQAVNGALEARKWLASIKTNKEEEEKNRANFVPCFYSTTRLFPSGPIGDLHVNLSRLWEGEGEGGGGEMWTQDNIQQQSQWLRAVKCYYVPVENMTEEKRNKSEQRIRLYNVNSRYCQKYIFQSRRYNLRITHTTTTQFTRFTNERTSERSERSEQQCFPTATLPRTKGPSSRCGSFFFYLQYVHTWCKIKIMQPSSRQVTQLWDSHLDGGGGGVVDDDVRPDLSSSRRVRTQSQWQNEPKT